MTCAAPITKFRLLDAYVGWDEGTVEHLVGLDDPAGLTLALLQSGAINPNAVDPFIPPSRLTPGCGPCEWFLAAPVRQEPDTPWRIMTLTPCTTCFDEVRPGALSRRWFSAISAIAYTPFVLAVADAERTTIFALGDGRILAELPVTGVVAFACHGELLVATVANGITTVRRLLSNGQLGLIAGNIAATAERLAVDRHGTPWLVARGAQGALLLFRVVNGDAVPATLKELEDAFERTRLRVTAPEGFCVDWSAEADGTAQLCASWTGDCIDRVTPTRPQMYERQGQLLTLAIDSGVPGCRWHRVRADAAIPSGTQLAVAISTSEEETPTAQGNAGSEPAWSLFAAGIPHPSDWQTAPAGGTADFLVHRQPAGRYLFVRLRLTGDGRATPTVRRVQLDFERATSLDFLPAVYRDGPEAEDFTERFLSMFDALLERLDSAIQYAPALLDREHLPEGALPWMASFYDLLFEREWSTAQRRRILSALPELFRRRGTPGALRQAIELVFGVSPAIDELPAARAWTALGRHGLPVGQARLFSRGRARLRLGGSPLGGAPLKHLGNPALDPIQSHAYRFTVRVPPVGPYGAIRAEAVQKLVESQKPAHTVVAGSIVASSGGFILGGLVAVGIDTAFAALPPSRLGVNLRLSRQSIVWHGQHGPRPLYTLAPHAGQRI